MYVGGKMSYLHYDPKSALSMEKENAILAWQFKHAHYMWVAKCHIGIMTLNPHYLHGKGKCNTCLTI